MKSLLVEDNPADARLILEMLKEHPAERIDFGQEGRLDAAINRLKSEKFDLVLLDLGLPDSTGIETLSAVQQAGGELPIVVLTGLDDQNFASGAVRAGAQDYLVKGQFDGKVLAQTIRYAIERKRAEKTLQYERKRFFTVLDGLPAYVVLLSPDYHVLFANRFFNERFGEAQSRKCYEHLFDRTAPCENCQAFQVFETHKPHHWEWTGPDGRTYDVFDFPFTDADRSPLLMEMGLDITERKRAEEQLRLQSSALQAAANGIIITDREGKIEWVNNAFTMLTGYSAGEVSGKNPRLLKSGKQPLDFYQQMWGTISAGQVWHGSLANKRKDGTIYDEEMTITPVRSAGGEITHYIAIKLDITERLKAQRLALRSQRLESLGTLAGGIAHDLNNALAPIIMSMELLQMEYPNESKTLDVVQASAKRAADMVRQLLTFAKGAEGARVSLNPKHLIKEMKAIIQTSFPKNIQLETRCEQNLPTILGDATQLHQVLLNLCVNARDAMPYGGLLTLEAERRNLDATYAASQPDARPGEFVVLSVRDNGTGIQPDALDHLFEPFYTTKGPDRGTGLGLSTVMGIAKGHGGFIQVHSEPEKGSIFAVYLPVERLPVEHEEDGAEHSAKAATSFHGKGESILLVDDDAMVRDVGRTVLARLGFNPLSAHDGAEGILIAVEHRVDLSAALLDLHMLHMDGVALARTLRRLRPDLPIAAMSGRFGEAEKAELDELGVTAHLAKPFTEAQLAETLQKLLASK